jgi:hypothetical protein
VCEGWQINTPVYFDKVMQHLIVCQTAERHNPYWAEKFNFLRQVRSAIGYFAGSGLVLRGHAAAKGGNKNLRES